MLDRLSAEPVEHAALGGKDPSGFVFQGSSDRRHPLVLFFWG